MFDQLWKNPSFVKCVISIVWDKKQCVSKWVDIQPEYKDMERLCYLLPKDVPFYVKSLTLPPLLLHYVMSVFAHLTGQCIHHEKV